MEKNAEYFENWRKNLEERYAPFKEFLRKEKERHDNFATGELHFDITKETGEEWHQRVVIGMADKWNAACDADRKWWYKNMSMFNGIKLWDSMTDEQQAWCRRDKWGMEKWALIHDCQRYIDDEIEDFMRQYNDWHFSKYGWCAIG